MNTTEIKIKKLHPDAVIPKFATSGAACFDLHAIGMGAEEKNVLDFIDETLIIRTGLSFEIPQGYAMMIYSRSGHGFKNDIRLSNCVGVIDSDYRGEVMVKLIKDSHGDGYSLVVNTGSRIAQAMIVKLLDVSFSEVDDLSETDRGTGGFGSTGQ